MPTQPARLGAFEASGDAAPRVSRGPAALGAGAGEGRSGEPSVRRLAVSKGGACARSGVRIAAAVLAGYLAERGVKAMTRATAHLLRRTIRHLRGEALNKAVARKGACMSALAQCQDGCTLLWRPELCKHSATRSFFWI